MISDIEITYERRVRSRSISISVRPGGAVHVRYPFFASLRKAEEFVEKKSDWIRAKVSRQKHTLALPKPTKKHYLEHKEEIRRLLQERLEVFNKHYKLEWKGIRIGRQKSRWGSCSRGKTLSFNYLLFFLPEEIRDYVVVHELCHLKQMNHSSAFWNLVAETVPDWKKIRKEMKRYQSY